MRLAPGPKLSIFPAVALAPRNLFVCSSLYKCLSDTTPQLQQDKLDAALEGLQRFGRQRLGVKVSSLGIESGFHRLGIHADDETMKIREFLPVVSQMNGIRAFQGESDENLAADPILLGALYEGAEAKALFEDIRGYVQRHVEIWRGSRLAKKSSKFRKIMIPALPFISLCFVVPHGAMGLIGALFFSALLPLASGQDGGLRSLFRRVWGLHGRMDSFTDLIEQVGKGDASSSEWMFSSFDFQISKEAHNVIFGGKRDLLGSAESFLPGLTFFQEEPTLFHQYLTGVSPIVEEKRWVGVDMILNFDSQRQASLMIFLRSAFERPSAPKGYPEFEEAMESPLMDAEPAPVPIPIDVAAMNTL